jgi:hypothetical protein
MKVYLGPYKNYWYSRVFYDYMDKKYSYDWDEATTTFEKFLEKLQDALQWVYTNTVNRIKGKSDRKIKVKIHDYDVWGLDNTLAYIILPSLKLMKEQKQGTPMTDREDAPADPIYDDEPSKNEWDRPFSEKRWEYIVNEMIHAFECEVNDDWDDQFHTGKIDNITVPEVINGKTYYRWEKGPNDTHVFDAEGHKKAWERRQNGLRLFAKYYHSLWT